MNIRLITFCSLLAVALQVSAQAIPVKVQKTESGWQLLRGGEPYYIRGAGGTGDLDMLVAAGGNSIRTWSADEARVILDDAYERGISVMVGLWMGQERQGTNYSDPYAVEDQLRSFRDKVRELKDHPAVLLWGVGNEVDLFYTDFNVWDAVEDICAMIHEEDPNHPTCVVTAGIDVAEIQMMAERAPSVDLLGFNTYGELPNVPRLVDRYGYTGPYLVTEWGTDGHWEVQKTDFGVPIEPTGTQKARNYAERYQNVIAADSTQCLGSYAFLWSQKQETTPTWYGVFLEDGTPTASVEALADSWGKPPVDRAPILEAYTFNGQDAYSSVHLAPGEKVDVQAQLRDPEGKPLRIKWELLPESTDIRAGGDFERRPTALSLSISGDPETGFSFKAPRTKGSYRLFVYAFDEGGTAVAANFPFYVD
jgi:hypothetical protein